MVRRKYQLNGKNLIYEINNAHLRDDKHNVICLQKLKADCHVAMYVIFQSDLGHSYEQEVDERCRFLLMDTFGIYCRVSY